MSLPAFLADALAAHIAPRAKESERFVFESMKGGPLVYGTFYAPTSVRLSFEPSPTRSVVSGSTT